MFSDLSVFGGWSTKKVYQNLSTDCPASKGSDDAESSGYTVLNSMLTQGTKCEMMTHYRARQE